MSGVTKNNIPRRLRALAEGGTLSDTVCALLIEAAQALEIKRTEAQTAIRPSLLATRSGLKDGEEIVWPKGIEERYGISTPTRWRWERGGRLPPRDVNIGAGKSGWRKSTLERWESRQ